MEVDWSEHVELSIELWAFFDEALMSSIILLVVRSLCIFSLRIKYKINHGAFIIILKTLFWNI